MRKAVPLIAVVGCISEEMKNGEGKKQLETLGIRKVYAASDGKSSLEAIRKSCHGELADTMNHVISDIKKYAARG